MTDCHPHEVLFTAQTHGASRIPCSQGSFWLREILPEADMLKIPAWDAKLFHTPGTAESKCSV